MSFTVDDYTIFTAHLYSGGPDDTMVNWLDEHVRSERDMFQFMFTSMLIIGACIRQAGGAPANARFGVVNAGTDEADRHTMHVMSMVGASLNDDQDMLSALVKAAITWPEDDLAVMNGRMLALMYQVMHALDSEQVTR